MEKMIVLAFKSFLKWSKFWVRKTFAGPHAEFGVAVIRERSAWLGKSTCCDSSLLGLEDRKHHLEKIRLS